MTALQQSSIRNGKFLDVISLCVFQVRIRIRYRFFKCDIFKAQFLRLLVFGWLIFFLAKNSKRIFTLSKCFTWMSAWKKKSIYNLHIRIRSVHTVRKSRNITVQNSSPIFWYVVLIMWKNIMETKLKSCTGVLVRAELTGHGHPTLFGRKWLIGHAHAGS